MQKALSECSNIFYWKAFYTVSDGKVVERSLATISFKFFGNDSRRWGYQSTFFTPQNSENCVWKIRICWIFLIGKTVTIAIGKRTSKKLFLLMLTLCEATLFPMIEVLRSARSCFGKPFISLMKNLKPKCLQKPWKWFKIKSWTTVKTWENNWKRTHYQWNSFGKKVKLNLLKMVEDYRWTIDFSKIGMPKQVTNLLSSFLATKQIWRWKADHYGSTWKQLEAEKATMGIHKLLANERNNGMAEMPLLAMGTLQRFWRIWNPSEQNIKI